MHDADFDHVHGSENQRDEDHPLWQTEHIELLSVGIDIGSATTQVIFSRLHLRRMGRDFSSRYVVISRESVYRSPVHLTPYLDGERIDDHALGHLIEDAYHEAGLEPGNIDTGAIILTGEAIRRRNARAIADLFAAQGGRFVCATAGHHMESLLAAHGSGAAALAHEGGKCVLNIDIGGGTTKLAVIDKGRVTATAALHIGGRLVAMDNRDKIVRLEPAGREIAKIVGYDWNVGDSLSREALDRVGAWMAEAVLTAVSGKPLPAEIAGLFLTPALPAARHFDGVTFSGGVAEYVYGAEKNSFGDIGAALGAALRARVGRTLPWPVLTTKERIRATVIGASQYSVQVSGNTIYISDPGALPQRNLQVLRPAIDLSAAIDPKAMAAAIKNHFAAFDLVEGETNVVLAFNWQGEPSYQRVSAFADGLLQGMPRTFASGGAINIVFDRDIGRLVGALLKEERKIANPVLSIDGIVLLDFDFVDIGKILEASGTVPVTIKSLIFQL